MSEPGDLIYLGTVEGPDDGLRWHEDGTMWYHPDLDQRDEASKAYTMEALESIPRGVEQ
jgi:hypothetical protein